MSSDAKSEAAKKLAEQRRAEADAKKLELAAAIAKAAAAGVRAPSPSAARSLSAGRAAAPELTQRKGGAPAVVGGGGVRGDPEESKARAGGAAGGGAPLPLRLLLPAAGILATLALRSAYPQEMDYVGFYTMLAIQGVFIAASVLVGGEGWADWALVTGLGTLAALTRFWRIHDPSSIIFDEVRVRDTIFTHPALPPQIHPSAPPPPPFHPSRPPGAL